MADIVMVSLRFFVSMLKTKRSIIFDADFKTSPIYEPKFKIKFELIKLTLLIEA